MGLKKSSRLPSGSSAEQRRRSPATKRQGTNADVATRTLAVRARRAVERLRADALAVAEAGATSIKDMGRVMGVLKAKYTGMMDFGAVGALIKAQLG